MKKHKLLCLIGFILALFFMGKGLAVGLHVSVPDVFATPSNLLRIPIEVSDTTGLGIKNSDITLSYDPDWLCAREVYQTPFTSERGWTLVGNTDLYGEVRIAMAGTSPLEGSGVLAEILFEVDEHAEAGASSPLTLDLIKFNGGAIVPPFSNGSVTVPMHLDVEVTITSTNPIVEPVICFSGINPAATNGVDADLDVITDFPPSPVGIPYLISAFKGPGTLFFSKDIRANGPWMLVVNTDNNFVLSWNISSVPPDTSLFLNPEDGSPIINMREQDNQDFMAGIYVMTINISTIMLFPVTNFTASNPTNTTIDLTWTKPIDEDFAGALIVRSQNPITWNPTAGVSYSIDEVVAPEVIVRYIGADDHSTKPFTDTGLVPSTTYYYRAFAYDSEKNYSIGVEASGTTLLCGDVSGDGNITAHDAALVLQSVVGLKVLSPDELKAADVTNDGSVTALDAALILQYSVGLIAQFPAEAMAAAPALSAKSYEDALIEGIARLEAIHLNSEQQKVLEQLKSLISKRLLPKHTSLLQNYPNPFNPETWLPYELAKDATVTIRIYDVKGQLVRQLNVGKQEAGRYIDKKRAAYWDGKDELGQAVSSGLYFYMLKAGNFQAIRRMVIVK